MCAFWSPEGRWICSLAGGWVLCPHPPHGQQHVHYGSHRRPRGHLGWGRNWWFKTMHVNTPGGTRRVVIQPEICCDLLWKPVRSVLAWLTLASSRLGGEAGARLQMQQPQRPGKGLDWETLEAFAVIVLCDCLRCGLCLSLWGSLMPNRVLPSLFCPSFMHIFLSLH